tara:strand:- start:240 stop:422 length:183 start_codon:yes stop_codon:yes gene_type:complete
MNVCVIAIAVIKTIKVRGVVIDKRNVVNDKRIIEIKFIWMPGMRPVIIPVRIPMKSARIN